MPNIVSSDLNSLLAEYDSNARLIRACRGLVHQTVCHQKKITKALDAATAPSQQPDRALTRNFPVPHTDVVLWLGESTGQESSLRRGFVYRGKQVATWSGVETYVLLLRKVWNEFPERRNAIRSELNASATSRFGVADSPAALFPGRSPYWCRDKARKLVEGVFVDVNLSNVQKLSRLSRAVRTVGLVWGTDVKVFGLA